MLRRNETFFHVFEEFALNRQGNFIDPKPFKHATVRTALQAAASAALDGVGIVHHAVNLGEHFGSGSTSAVFALDVDERRYALRVQPPGSQDPYAPAEQLARKVARNAGLRTPDIHATHLDIPGERPNFTFTLEDLLVGRSGFEHYKKDETQVEPLGREMGAALKVIHDHPVTEGYGFFDVNAARGGVLRGELKTYRQHLTAGLQPTLKRVVKNGFLTSDEAGDIKKYFRGARTIDILGAEDIRLLHGDMALYNLFVLDGGDVLATDFGESRAGPVTHDLAGASVNFSRHGWDDKIDVILRGYEDAGGRLPGHIEKGMRVVRLRYLLAVVAGQSAYAKRHPEDQETRLFVNRAAAAMRKDATILKIFRKTSRG